MKHIRILLLTLIVYYKTSHPAVAQYSTAEERQFYHEAFSLIQRNIPARIGDWRLIREAEYSGKGLVAKEQPVNPGIYTVEYWAVFMDISEEDEQKRIDLILHAFKSSNRTHAPEDSIAAFRARHTCRIHISFNEPSVSLPFRKGAIRQEPAVAPFTSFVQADNMIDADNRQALVHATLIGMGPHSKIEIIRHEKDGSSGYVTVKPLLSGVGHPFSIQAIDIKIIAPHEVATFFIKALRLEDLNKLIGAVLAERTDLNKTPDEEVNYDPVT